MFHIRNAVRIIEYLLLSALTLSTGCLAASKDDYKYYFTTRRPFWEDYTDTPILRGDSPYDGSDMVVFFIVLIIGILVIAFLSCYYHQNSSSSSLSSSNGIIQPVAGGVIHPPPRNHSTLTSLLVPTAPRRSVDTPFTVSYTNTGYQSDHSVVIDGGRPGDAPPDYAAVALGDLTTSNSNFPAVVPMETPPPQYQTDGKPFR